MTETNWVRWDKKFDIHMVYVCGDLHANMHIILIMYIYVCYIKGVICKIFKPIKFSVSYL